MAKFKEEIPFSKITKIKPVIAMKINGKYENISQVKKRTGCSHIINFGTYTFSNRKLDSALKLDGSVIKQSYTGFGFAIDKNKLVWSYRGAYYDDFFGQWEAYIRDGVLMGNMPTAKRGRIGIGITDTSLIIAGVSEGSADALGTKAFMQSNFSTCKYAINGDGSASAQWITPSCKSGITRDVVWYLCIWAGSDISTPPTDTTKEENKTMKTACIDAGHGVETLGKCSPDKSYFEHEFNLDIAKKIQSHLERCGIKVIMTRENEHDSPGKSDTSKLQYRCNICNNSKADIFLSIHTNAYGDGWTSPSGWSAHICGKGGNAEKLANTILNISIPALGVVNRGVNVDNYYVLKNTTPPSVLIEHGFHTNISEVEKLKSPEWRNKYAECDARGVCKFLGVTWVDEPKNNIPDMPALWYTDAQNWAINNKVSDGTRPLETATRAEIWQMLMNCQRYVNV